MAPSWAATSAGNRKIPAPIVVLTMPAASANVPIDRTSDDSDDGWCGRRSSGVAVTVTQVRVRADRITVKRCMVMRMTKASIRPIGFLLAVGAAWMCGATFAAAQPNSIQIENAKPGATDWLLRSEEHTSELQSLRHLVCRLL